MDLLAKARALFKKGEWDAAAEIYNEIIRKHPDRPEAFVGVWGGFAPQKKISPGPPRAAAARPESR